MLSAARADGAEADAEGQDDANATSSRSAGSEHLPGHAAARHWAVGQGGQPANVNMHG
jgi:hypothetical protein